MCVAVHAVFAVADAIQRVLLLIDARYGFKPADVEFLKSITGSSMRKYDCKHGSLILNCNWLIFLFDPQSAVEDAGDSDEMRHCGAAHAGTASRPHKGALERIVGPSRRIEAACADGGGQAEEWAASAAERTGSVVPASARAEAAERKARKAREAGEAGEAGSAD